MTTTVKFFEDIEPVPETYTHNQLFLHPGVLFQSIDMGSVNNTNIYFVNSQNKLLTFHAPTNSLMVCADNGWANIRFVKAKKRVVFTMENTNE